MQPTLIRPFCVMLSQLTLVCELSEWRGSGLLHDADTGDSRVCVPCVTNMSKRRARLGTEVQ